MNLVAGPEVQDIENFLPFITRRRLQVNISIIDDKYKTFILWFTDLPIF